jgi:hypothetical protein
MLSKEKEDYITGLRPAESHLQREHHVQIRLISPKNPAPFPLVIRLLELLLTSRP